MSLRPPVDSVTLSALLESFPCPALIVDVKRRIQAVNEAFRARVASDSEVIGARCFEVLHGRRRRCRQRDQFCPLDACVRTGTVVPAIHSHTPGTREQILLQPIPGDDGAVVACLATLQATTGAGDPPASEATGHARIAVAPVERQLVRLGRSRQPVLVLGESGTGRSRVARAIHQWRHSPGPFEEAKGLELTEDALRALWARARRHDRVGTLHLRDVHGLALRTQGVLVQALSAEAGGRRRWRLISSTDRDLRHLAAVGLFRRDLLSRLAAVKLHLPPLRARQSELPEIVRALLDDIGGDVSALTEAALERLRGYPFPGNLDELEQALRHASFMASGATAEADHLPDWLCLPSPPEPTGPRVAARGLSPRREGPGG